MLFRISCFILFGLLSSTSLRAQYREMKRFNTTNGLAGNTVYRCVEDQEGYLWICTESGISRFDGKQFQNFTTDQGLPDNEVLQVVCDLDNRIWVSCYKQGAAYFDQTKNRFINERENPSLTIPTSSSYIMLTGLVHGGVQYRSSKYAAIFLGNQPSITYHTDTKDTLIYSDFLDNKVVLKVTGSSLSKSRDSICKKNYYWINQNNKSGIEKKILEGCFSNTQFENNQLFLLDYYSNFILRIRITADGDVTKKDTLAIKNYATRFFVSRNYLFVYNKNGSADVHDCNTLRYLFTIQGNYTINAIYEDRLCNLWVSTRNHGLILFTKTAIEPLHLPELQERAVYSFLSPSPNEYYAGLNDNTILHHSSTGTTIKPLIKKNATGNVFGMLLFNKNLYGFSENNVCVNYTKEFNMNTPTVIRYQYKCMSLLPNNRVALGGYNRLDFLSLTTDSITLNTTTIRATACAAQHEDTVWLGSIDGLWCWTKFGKTIRPKNFDPLMKERITDLSFSYDGTLWIATASNGIYSYKNNKLQHRITKRNGLPSNQTKHIYADHLSQLWVATTMGVSILRLQRNGTMDIQNITSADGLTNNLVHHFYEQRDTMFLSSENGVQKIPLNYKITARDIPVAVLRVFINNKDTSMLKTYQLPYNKYAISLMVGGIELLGHFHHIEYRLNENEVWVPLEGNTLNINLSSGNYNLDLRTVDINGLVGKKIRTLTFQVATPYWKNIWFWIPFLILSQSFIAWYWYRFLQRKHRLRQKEYEEKIRVATLEQQAYTALLNPHFIFNSLNGIQHFLYTTKKEIAENYIGRLTKLIRQSFEMAQQTFVSLDDEIAHINQYVSLEQQRYESSFDFVIHVDPEIDTEEVMIPSMLLQPLVENALVHGSLQENPQGKLEVFIEEKRDGIQYAIRDNGKGFQAKAALSKDHHQSLGSQLIAKRLHALGLLCSKEIKLEIRTPFPENVFKGYEVRFFLPAELYAVWKQQRRI
ncbi:MAG: histidine kinase [Chitinophagaceae bacterium]|nr:histidine kinase [Chitinophagaceae bacterium]